MCLCAVIQNTCAASCENFVFMELKSVELFHFVISTNYEVNVDPRSTVLFIAGTSACHHIPLSVMSHVLLAVCLLL